MRLSQPFTDRLSKSFVFNTCFQSEGYVKGKPYYPLYAKKEPMPLYTYRAYIGKPFTTCTLHFFLARFAGWSFARPVHSNSHEEKLHEENCHL
jgi:hypothetical protein